MSKDTFASRLRRAAAAALAGGMALSCAAPLTTAAQTDTQPTVLADWRFEESAVVSGSIAGGDLVLADASGNGNELSMRTFGAADSWDSYLQFSADSMTGDAGSMVFNGDTASKTGADFITVESAPINAEEFRGGYTMEFLYYFPEDWTAADSWMSLIRRQNTGSSVPEGEQGSMYASISNCKEIQFCTAPADNDHTMSSAAWSVSMDEGGVWYHIAITSDGHTIRTFVNGCEAFRDYVSDEMQGMYAGEDGRFCIGSSWWNGLDKFLQGSLQEVRISAGALPQEQWLIPDPTQYIGDYGSNEQYQLKNEENYTFVLLPDTQNTVEYRPDVMETAVDELIASADELNVAGVVHLGDVVDDSGDAVQYNNARDIFYKLPQAGVKFLVQPGNHDNWSGNGSSYWHFFGADSKTYMNLTSSYLTTKAWSGAMFVEAGSYTYMVISLACEGGKTSWNPTSGELEWFEQMLQKYPNCPTIVTRHDIQNCSDTQPSAVKLSSEGEKLWEIVKKYPQVFMMVGGHSHGSGVETLTNDAGLPVFSMLTDFQFAYNGGNGFFRWLEFDENADKIWYSVYSPYSASLSDEEKTFFDVNFMTGAGNEGSLDIDFATRFAGMENTDSIPTEGRWLSGEYHTHTTASNDSPALNTLEQTLDAAFHEDAQATAPAGTAFHTDDLDYLMLADHLRYADSNPDGSSANLPRYQAIAQQLREFEAMIARGKFADKLLFAGFEWDMPGLDHASVAVIDSDGEVALDGIHGFEWLFADQKNDADSLFDNDLVNETEVYGPRRATVEGDQRNNVEVAYQGVQWLSENYPDSFVLPNHPSRHNNGDDTVDLGEVTVEYLRRLNDIDPHIVFGFEGMPGNQMSPDGTRSEMNDIYGGADVMLAQVGGAWDSMLAEGRHFYNFANSDFHFKVSGSNSSGYWPGEYSRTYTWVEGNTFADVVDGMRTGNSFSVYGDLIDALDFTANTAAGSAVMGSDLSAVKGDTVTLTIRFRSPEDNNYAPISGEGSADADAAPTVDHIDLIAGSITGMLDESEYDTATSDAAVIRTFTRADWGEPDAEGYYTVTCEVPADKDTFYRLRGTNLSTDGSDAAYIDENGNPKKDISFSGVTDAAERMNAINDRNYENLWFYSNPIFVYTDAQPQPTAQPTAEPTTAPTAQPTAAPTASPAPVPSPDATQAPAATAAPDALPATGDGFNVVLTLVLLVGFCAAGALVLRRGH